jgi:2-polyprenyl-6-methoxyphenol hydroxylase-like FAD-dependent oxidoreductase
MALGVTSESFGCGARFGIVPIGRKRVYWYAVANAPAGRTQEPAEQRDYLRRRFGGWHRPIEALIESAMAEKILHNDIYDIKPMSEWSRGRAVLLGDAAHPTTPNMGQGACMAIESALVLARCLARGDNLEASLRRYEQERMPRTAWVTNQSWKIGRVGQLENRLACVLRDFVIGVTPDFVIKKQLSRAVSFEA